MREYTYEELKEQILAIKTQEEFDKKANDLKYKIINSYYNYSKDLRHSITKSERNALLDFLSFRRYELFEC